MSDEPNKNLSLKGLKKEMDDQAEAVRQNFETLTEEVGNQAEVLESIGTNMQAMTQAVQQIQASFASGARNYGNAQEAAGMDLGDGQIITDDTLIDRPNLTVAKSNLFKDDEDRNEFMNQMVKIRISEASGRYDDQVFQITVSGRIRVFRRGEVCIVRRYFVEGLARCKPLLYDNEKYVNQRGEDAYRYPVTASLRYPFVLLEDRDPKDRGHVWLELVVAEP